jgi:hypothetical protein
MHLNWSIVTRAHAPRQVPLRYGFGHGHVAGSTVSINVHAGDGTMEVYHTGQEMGQVRTTRATSGPSWPRSWGNFSLVSLCSHRNVWANLHILGQPNAFPYHHGISSWHLILILTIPRPHPHPGADDEDRGNDRNEPRRAARDHLRPRQQLLRHAERHRLRRLHHLRGGRSRLRPAVSSRTVTLRLRLTPN